MASDGFLSVGRSLERKQVHVRASDLRSVHVREPVAGTKSGGMTIRVYTLGARYRDNTQAGARKARILVAQLCCRGDNFI